MSSTTVNFNLKTAGFANYANQTLTFRLLKVSADKTDDTVILPGIVTATSAANGTGSAALFTTGESDIESTFEVIFPNREKGLFQIPATSAGGSIHLSDLLVDHVPGGSAAPQNSVYDAAVAYSIQRGNHTGQVTLATAISDAATFQLKPSEGAFVNGDKTKLTNIETAADVTDTANVTAAGALMDSEMQDGTGAAIKSLTLPTGTATTINAFARDSLLNSDATLIKSALGVADTSAIAGFVPNSITFPATSAFLSIANEADLNVGTGDFTLSFWARLDSSGTQPVLDKFSGTGYSLKFSSGSLVLTMQDAGGPLTATFGSSLNDNKWHVYVVSVDRSGNAVAYIDNVAQTALSVTAVDATLDNTTVFRIGFDGSNAGSGIALGNYVVLHKEALSASEAAQIYFSADAALIVGDPLPTLMVDLRETTETFTDVSASPLPIVTNGSIRFNQDRLTEFTGTNVLATSTLGYTTGSGGTQTQGTSKSTTVLLNKATGQITLHGAALGANTNVAFALTNSTIAANDILVFNHVSGGTIGAYNFNAVAGSGTATVTVRNITGSSLTETPVISFAVIKAVTS